MNYGALFVGVTSIIALLYGAYLVRKALKELDKK